MVGGKDGFQATRVGCKIRTLPSLDRCGITLLLEPYSTTTGDFERHIFYHKIVSGCTTTRQKVTIWLGTYIYALPISGRITMRFLVLRRYLSN